MKKIIALFLIIFLTACSSNKAIDSNNKLYQLLISKENGGAAFEFYETITDAKEFKVLLGDEEIKKFVKPNDILKSNFVLINLGEKKTGGYGIEKVIVTEEPTKIFVTIIKKEPKPGENVTTEITQPYGVLKINSKKPIEINN
jgi:hypothetical protein